MNRTEIIEHYKNFHGLDEITEDCQIDIDFAQVLIEIISQKENLPDIRFRAKDVDSAYFMGVFNSGGIDRLHEEVVRIKELKVMPHQMIDTFKKIKT